MQPDDWSRLKKGWPHLKKLDIPPPVLGRPVEAILGCTNLGFFEALRPAAMKGPAEPIAKFTPLGWMVGGRTCPEMDSVEEGRNNVHSGTILVGQGKEGPKDQVSYAPQAIEGLRYDKVTEGSDIAGELNLYQDCGGRMQAKL